MNKAILSAIMLLTLGSTQISQAQDHTITLGYSQSHFEEFGGVNGVNVKYRYEWNSPWSVISSFTYMDGNTEKNYQRSNYNVKAHGDVDYYSLSVGPAYRINDYVSLYTLLGVATGTFDYSADKYSKQNQYMYHMNKDGSKHKTTFMYGTGVQVNLMENFAIDVGYEGTHMEYQGMQFTSNGFNVGAGYRF
ncbi:Ail/Lom family outer membrane beta-barrel protein [Budviciaceae bacterium BWR-B9]|uniref:Ail/Lom family outer membrane beta-barrel protein n=1 Tax=Limnobaculum allomyrinae TaxID=2791986 RepID=A0ABS1IV33_9GAMM|nr:MULTISPECIES: Ail/Lom family outer membrane beta-barrel protein [Limnobaculum]MBK5145623.1 Ail/Lom family outer membrane beta-barrel protein [Limnobaculum allomyrinae]MBV7692568.1 Ail/Lom family outer membrane beta-barrel protein [Limnobaculum sp. M2-1]